MKMTQLLTNYSSMPQYKRNWANCICLSM